MEITNEELERMFLDFLVSHGVDAERVNENYIKSEEGAALYCVFLGGVSVGYNAAKSNVSIQVIEEVRGKEGEDAN